MGLHVRLYGVIHPEEDQILYIGKADGSTVRQRWNADDKHNRVWQRMEEERGLMNTPLSSVSSACPLAGVSRANLFAT